MASKRASLWNGSSGSLFADTRASQVGDILTVIVDINESAEFSNNSETSRNSSESASVPQLFGIPQKLDKDLPEGASYDELVDLSSNSQSSGQGSISRNEALSLRLAAVVEQVFNNGAMFVRGSQEIVVNFELRRLEISGLVQRSDINRLNEVPLDRIASARVNYGGRGHISDVQQSRYGNQVLGRILPF